MQRDAITLETLADRDNLLLATWKAARGKRARPAVQRFLSRLDLELTLLTAEILEERAPRGLAHRFTIHDPKRREISAACFADRVLHHAILNLAEARFERMSVPTSFACRPGKGVHAAVTLVRRNLQRWPWFVQVDVDGYFPSINHARLKALLATRFTGRGFLALLGRIIDAGAGAAPGCGLPIGSLTSQHFANAYLDLADRLLLAHPMVCAHVRYMDDIAWWCPTREAAMRTLDALRAGISRDRCLRLKPAGRVARSAEGMMFCGFRIRQGVVLASSRKLRRYRAGARHLHRAVAAGSVGEQHAQRVSDGLLATLAGCQTLGFQQRLQAALGDAGELA